MLTHWHRINALLLSLVLLALLAVLALLAGDVRGGPLDPPGDPAPTGRPLDELYGSWSRTLPADDGEPGPSPPAGCNSSRFQCVFDDIGVLDLETGLVWERFPNNSSIPWAAAESSCAGQFSGGRSGWRLPTIEEFNSLIDPNAQAAPFLPEGHPFVGASPDVGYWTATTYSLDASLARVSYLDLSGGNGPKFSANSNDWRLYWCVRGGQGFLGM